MGEPYDVKRDSVVHAQFNASYSFARALSDGKVDLASYQKPRITDGAVAALAARTTVVSDPAIDAAAIEPARVRLKLKDGHSVESASDTIKGSPQAPLSERELTDKFADCLAFGLGATRAESDRLAQLIAHLESSTDVARDLVAAFPAA